MFGTESELFIYMFIMLKGYNVKGTFLCFKLNYSCAEESSLLRLVGSDSFDFKI